MSESESSARRAEPPRRAAWPSLPTRIFLAFALVIAAFVGVALFGLVQHERTSRTLQRLHDGYLPLALQLGEARAAQGIVAAFLDRVRGERDTAATRGWLEAARRRRPVMVRRARRLLEDLRRSPEDAREAASLRRIGVALGRVERGMADSEQVLRRLLGRLAQEQGGPSAGLLERVRAREREVQRNLAAAWRLVRQQIAETGRQAAERQRRTATALAVATLLALALGMAVLWWSARVLRPLRQLSTRVQAVARGDWRSQPLAPRRDDELGRLATEFERMVAALERTKERLLRTERLAAVGKLAAHVTHEVRNPLSSLALNVELLEDELREAPEETRALLAAVQAEIDRLTGLTEEYLRLARLPEPDVEPRDVGEVVRRLADFVAPEFERAGVDLRLEIAEERLEAPVDEGQLRQALLNLLRNAREAAGHGGHVWLSVARSGDGHIEVVVEDDGPGIDPEARERLFDVFFTTKARGTGLGLPLAQQIVTAHGGELRCASGRAGGGARFVLRLPGPVEDGASSGRPQEAG